MAWFGFFKRKANEPAPAAAPRAETPAPTPAPASTATPPPAAASAPANAPAAPVDATLAAQQKWETALTVRAEAWVQALPESSRPSRLCAELPRLANRLAVVWSDPARTAAVLDELLIDRRGGRQGFKPEIVTELRAIEALSQARVTREGRGEGTAAGERPSSQ